MSVNLVAIAIAAVSAATAPAAEVKDLASAPVVAPKASRLLLAAAAAAVAATASSEETIEIYPMQFLKWRDAGKPADSPQFEVGGLGVSFAAWRRKAQDETPALRDFRSETRAMGKFMPGYPQPARVIVGVKVSF